jgi:hypothetical protein
MPTINNWDYTALACPFCKGQEITLRVRASDLWIKGWISCNHCCACGPEARELVCLKTSRETLQTKIVELWNQAPRRVKK